MKHLKHLMWVLLGLGVWLAVSPFALEFVNRRTFRFGWEDFLLGFGVVVFTLCRLAAPNSSQLWDLLTMAVGLTTLLNPMIYHYLGVKAIAWNNLVVGSTVLMLAMYAHRKTLASSRK